MSTCIDRDDLVSLTGILGEGAVVALEHIASCERCLETVSWLEALHKEVTAASPVGETVVDLIMKRVEDVRGAVEPETSASSSPSRSVALEPKPANPLLPATGFAGLVFLVVVLLLTTAPGSSFSATATFSLVGVGLPALIAAVVAARLALAENQVG